MNLRRDFELLNIVETVIDYGNFGSWTTCFLHSDVFKILWGQGVQYDSLNINAPHKIIWNDTTRRCVFFRSRCGTEGSVSM